MKNKVFEDTRGLHMKFFEDFIAKEEGFRQVKEIFTTTNKKNVIRAFHFQGNPQPQQKIVKPVSGRFNVRVIDMKNKKVIEYDNWTNKSDPIFVKAGNMLGYVALEDNSVMLYVADEKFVSELNYGVHPHSFQVDWKAGTSDFIISERDKKAEIAQFEY